MALNHSDIQKAALAFGEALRPEDRLMVLSFGDLIYVESEFTNDRNRIRDAILQTRIRWARSRLYDVLDMIITERMNRIQGRKAIVLFTDGVDAASRLTDAPGSLARIEESDVLIYSIQYNARFAAPAYAYDEGYRITIRQFTREDLGGYGDPRYQKDGQGAKYLRDLSANSGGLRFIASKMPDLQEILGQIAAELRNKYTVCFYPSTPAGDESFHRIRVTVDRPEVRIRSRSGYRPSGGMPEKR